jgi:hypothetical protein
MMQVLWRLASNRRLGPMHATHKTHLLSETQVPPFAICSQPHFTLGLPCSHRAYTACYQHMDTTSCLRNGA